MVRSVSPGPRAPPAPNDSPLVAADDARAVPASVSSRAAQPTRGAKPTRCSRRWPAAAAPSRTRGSRAGSGTGAEGQSRVALWSRGGSHDALADPPCSRSCSRPLRTRGAPAEEARAPRPRQSGARAGGRPAAVRGGADSPSSKAAACESEPLTSSLSAAACAEVVASASASARSFILPRSLSSAVLRAPERAAAAETRWKRCGEECTWTVHTAQCDAARSRVREKVRCGRAKPSTGDSHLAGPTRGPHGARSLPASQAREKGGLQLGDDAYAKGQHEGFPQKDALSSCVVGSSGIESTSARATWHGGTCTRRRSESVAGAASSGSSTVSRSSASRRRRLVASPSDSPHLRAAHPEQARRASELSLRSLPTAADESATLDTTRTADRSTARARSLAKRRSERRSAAPDTAERPACAQSAPLPDSVRSAQLRRRRSPGRSKRETRGALFPLETGSRRTNGGRTHRERRRLRERSRPRARQG